MFIFLIKKRNFVSILQNEHSNEEKFTDGNYRITKNECSSFSSSTETCKELEL